MEDIGGVMVQQTLDTVSTRLTVISGLSEHTALFPLFSGFVISSPNITTTNNCHTTELQDPHTNMSNDAPGITLIALKLMQMPIWDNEMSSLMRGLLLAVFVIGH